MRRQKENESRSELKPLGQLDTALADFASGLRQTTAELLPGGRAPTRPDVLERNAKGADVLERDPNGKLLGINFAHEGMDLYKSSDSLLLADENTFRHVFAKHS